MSLYPDINASGSVQDWSSYQALTSILGNQQDLTDIGIGNITNLETDTIALRPGTLATFISLTDDLEQVGSSKTIKTEGDVISSQGGVQPYSLNYIGNIVYGGGGGTPGPTGPQGPTGANGVGAFLSGTCIDGATYIVPPGSFNINSYGSSLMVSSTPAVDAYMTYASTLGNQSWTFVGTTGTFTTPFPIPAPSIYGPDPSGNILWELPQDPLSLQFIWGLNGGEQYNIFLTAVSPYGSTGPIGPTGATGPFSIPLANKIEVVSASDVSSTALDWSVIGPTGNVYVPLADSLSLAPASPSTGTGWRMTKPTSFLATSMISGTAYTVNFVGTTNWTLIGWTAPVVVGSSATYNGVAVTGTGTVTLTSVYGTNISWFPLNLLYGLALPQGASAVPPVAVPSPIIRKKNLNAVWALVRFNNDIAQQGYFSLTVESYAYQFGGNTSNNYTGRWAYSLPMYAVAGGSAVQFNAGTTLTTTQPRAVGGFTYLLYIEDKYPKMLPNIAGQFQVSNGMFGSQSQVAHTTRDPYDIYPEYQHFPLNAVLYTENATQPTYGGSSPYADQGDVEVATVYFKTTQSPNAPQRPQPDFDFQVLSMGFRGTDDAGAVVSQNYTLSYGSPAIAFPT